MKIFKSNGIYKIIMLLFIVIFWLSSFVFGKSKTKELHHRDKLFNSLVQNSDTIYAMYDVNKREYIYTTNNAYEVLGIKESEKETNQIINQIFEIPVLKNELEEWNQKSEFVSQMLAFKNPAYQHTRWIKVKIYPFKDKKLNYNVILISDVTKEHDQQHLLVTQAADIKTREKIYLMLIEGEEYPVLLSKQTVDEMIEDNDNGKARTLIFNTLMSRNR